MRLFCASVLDPSLQDRSNTRRPVTLRLMQGYASGYDPYLFPSGSFEVAAKECFGYSAYAFPGDIL